MASGATAKAAAADGRTPVLADRWEIGLDTPLPAYDRPSALGYAARDRTSPDKPLLALVCATSLPMRIRPATLVMQEPVPGLLRLHAFGAVAGPHPGERRMALIYDRPAGPPLLSVPAGGDGRQAPGFDLERLRAVLRPVVQALHQLSRLGIAHRGLRPDNLWAVGGNETGAVLGCAFAGPAGFDQPSVFESVERAGADRAGRGAGSAADDLFAFGVTLLALASGRYPGQGRSDEELLSERLERGSYTVLSEGFRVPALLQEPLRGLIADDPRERWTDRDLLAWFDGRRPGTHVIRPRSGPDQPFVFAGKAYLDVRALAAAVTRHPGEAVQAVHSRALALWLRRSCRDPVRAKRLCELTGSGRGPVRKGSEDQLIASLCRLLDPAGPIHHRGRCFTFDGFAAILAEEVLQAGDVQGMIQAVRQYLGSAPAAAEENAAAETGPVAYSTYLSYLEDPRLGFGIERLLYAANPGLRCLSPPLRGSCVTSLAELLPALEAAAGSPDAGSAPVDRHVAAFVAARADIEPLLKRMGEADHAEQAIGQLALLAWIAGQHPGAPTPQLAAWCGRSLSTAVGVYRHRDTRAQVEREVRRAVPQGDLRALLAIIDDPARRRLDRQGFLAAQSAYSRAEAEVRGLASSGPARQRASRALGVRAAVAVALTAACMSAGLTLILAGS